MNNEEKLVIEGGRVKLLCERRQLEAKSQNGIIVDYLRFTVKRDLIPDTKRIPRESEDRDLVKYYALIFANLLGFELGIERPGRSEEHTSELQSPCNLVCRLLLEKKKIHTHPTSLRPSHYTLSAPAS